MQRFKKISVEIHQQMHWNVELCAKWQWLTENEAFGKLAFSPKRSTSNYTQHLYRNRNAKVNGQQNSENTCSWLQLCRRKELAAVIVVAVSKLSLLWKVPYSCNFINFSAVLFSFIHIIIFILADCVPCWIEKERKNVKKNVKSWTQWMRAHRVIPMLIKCNR